ncbi:MAG: hypothetical protein GC162_11385 [Planctomycetes bacterium]|nr:hypothetical protein [Planctomycetota bacterium]
MKTIHTFISPVLTISLLIFAVIWVTAHGVVNFGPCGPTDLGGVLWLIGDLVAPYGILVGLALSLVKTADHFARSPRQ